MSKETKIAKRFLSGIHSESTQSAFKDLVSLIENLEIKVDPDPVEIRIVESLYHFLEKFKVLEHNLNSYVIEEDESSVENKLNSLYESSTSYGSSKFFE